MQQIFEEYEFDSLNDSSLLRSNNQEEKDQWLVRYSKATHHDLTEFMKGTWKLEVSDAAVEEVVALGLPTWMPAMVSV